MFWWILFWFLVIINIILFIIKRTRYIALILALIIAILFVPCIVGTVRAENELNDYKRMKTYIESQPYNPDDKGLSDKRAQYNEWLIQTKNRKQHYGIFLFYSDEVLYLKEIEWSNNASN